MKPTYQEYLNTIIKNAKNDLCSPRFGFNSGYHDAAQTMRENWPVRDMANHFNPYYAAGYEYAINEYNTHFRNEESSESAWRKWYTVQSYEDQKVISDSILEAEIVHKEWLFDRKNSRKNFKNWEWEDIRNYWESVVNF